jgi:hypothetical protein
MANNDDLKNQLVSCLAKDGWRTVQDSCALPFPTIEGYEDKSGATSFAVEKGDEQVVVVAKRVAQPSEYPQIIRSIINWQSNLKPSVGDVETEVIIDEQAGHFALNHSGWVNGYRIHGAVVHIDIRDGKIWIQHDGTEYGIATELIAFGVQKEKIVLAFHSPEMRKYTDFAIA